MTAADRDRLLGLAAEAHLYARRALLAHDRDEAIADLVVVWGALGGILADLVRELDRMAPVPGALDRSPGSSGSDMSHTPIDRAVNAPGGSG